MMPSSEKTCAQQLVLASAPKEKERGRESVYVFAPAPLFSLVIEHCFQGRRVGPVLSHQVKTLIGEGNQAYVDNKIEEAIRVMQEVIRIEPRAASAWTVLAQCHDDLKDHSKALQLRVMSAHLLHDSEEWERLARQSRQAASGKFFGRNGLMRLSETWDCFNKHSTALERRTIWIRQMSTPCGIALR
jgi:hypothetical protein